MLQVQILQTSRDGNIMGFQKYRCMYTMYVIITVCMHVHQFQTVIYTITLSLQLLQSTSNAQWETKITIVEISKSKPFLSSGFLLKMWCTIRDTFHRTEEAPVFYININAV
jgi:hypothetical protein